MTMERLPNGSKLGNCLILEHIGGGLTGQVYKARYKDKGLVALKILDKEREQDHTVAGYFLNEQMLLREITEHRRHPNIVEHITSREVPPNMFLGTHYIEGGKTLEKLLYQPLPAGFTLNVVEQLSNALDYLHYGNPKYSPIIHRDIKPHNVLIGPSDEVILIDLSIARFPAYGLEKERGLGTVQYMPPEQHEGDESPATDQFALAVMTLRMLSGRNLLPTNKEQARAELLALHRDDYNSVRKMLGARSNTAEVLIKALQYAPSERYNSCEEFAFCLRRALIADGEAVDSARSPWQLPRFAIEAGVIAIVALLAVALLMVGLGFQP